MMLRIISFAVAVAVLGCFSLARADVPKPEEVAACNSEAKAAMQKGSAAPSTPAPTAGDHRRADEARRRNVPKDGTDTSTRSSDPQIEGMDPQGAKDPIYQAAYRTCMRRGGY